MAQVSLEQVRKVYPNGFVGVAGATFDVVDGELLVLVGPSGCGKSTLLRMIAGLEDITSGTLRIGERVVNDVAPKDRDIAMVFQSYALYPHMTVAENLGFGLKLRGASKAEIAARVDEAARVLELGKLLDRKPAALSGGQRQRVALGRALVRHPQVFLLDEPLSNLDAKLRAGMRVEIARLHRQVGATMVYVTHDQVEAMTLGQRIVVLKDGHVQQIDTPMALVRAAGEPVRRHLPRQPGDERAARAPGPQRWPGARPGRRTARPDGRGRRRPRSLARSATSRSACVPKTCCPPTGDAVAFDATIEMIEALGNETLVNVRVGPQALVSRMAPRTLPPPGECAAARDRPGPLARLRCGHRRAPCPNGLSDSHGRGAHGFKGLAILARSHDDAVVRRLPNQWFGGRFEANLSHTAARACRLRAAGAERPPHAPVHDQALRFQILRRSDHAAPADQHDRRGGAERLRQVEHHRRRALGDGRKLRQPPARRFAHRRHLLRQHARASRCRRRRWS